MKLIRPTKDLVNKYVGLTTIKRNIPIPSHDKAEWYKNHRDFVLRVLLPQIAPPKKTWKLVVEAYLTNVELEKGSNAGLVTTFEQCICDGSSVVPDWAYRWGNIKDPWAMGHDLAYVLHHLELKDAYGHKWGLLEAHRAYRDGWIAAKMPFIGHTWFTGLVIGGWFSWYKPYSNKPEKLTECIYVDRIEELHTYA